MRTGRRLLAGAVIAATVLTAATGATSATGARTDALRATPAQPSAPAMPVVTAVSVSPDHVSVHGLDLVPVTVSINLAQNEYGDPDHVFLYRTAKRAWDRSAPRELLGDLTRTAGSGSAGTYSATIRIPSSADGTWRVAAVMWTGAPGGWGVDPRSSGVADAMLAVAGTHRPRMRFSVSPQPLPYPQKRVTLRAVLSFDDTRTPVTGLPIAFGVEVDCAERLGPGALVPTDRHGVATRAVPVLGLHNGCAWAPYPGSSPFDSSPGWTRITAPVQLGTVTSASPSRTSARRRSPVAVTGKVVALQVPAREAVVLQRRVHGHWQTVGAGKIRANGRFTLTATPPSGRNLYRVQLQDSGWFGASASRPFTITGT